MSSFDPHWCRQHFPALARQHEGHSAVFLDGPAGSQVPRGVIEAISQYLVDCNANHGGVFVTSMESDALLERAHHAVADLLGSSDPGTVFFGQNMTSLTFAFSRALARTWQAGDEVIVTRLDHDANVTPWVLAARDAGATVHQVGFRHDDCTLQLDEFARVLSPRTRLVAVGCASNAVGTINPVQEIITQAHAVGAQVFLDAVHYAPHASIDVTAWDCDYLACSAYKFFGPHIGILYGKRPLLESLPAYKVRPAPDDLPGRWMTGTQSHEGIAGVLAAIDYLSALGRHLNPTASTRREALTSVFDAIQRYERGLGAYLLEELARIPDVRIWGITDPQRLHQRVPTVAITHAQRSSQEVATALARQGIFVWAGNFYALTLTETLGLEPDGLVRLGLLHYNTRAEVERLLDALHGL